MDDCTMVLVEQEANVNLWVVRMENPKSGCHHREYARLISKSTCLSDTSKEEIERLRVQSKWLDHVCALHGTKSFTGYGTFLLMGEYKESLQTKLQRDKRLTVEEIQRYGSDIICGVGQLHHAGIVCMDIQPSTVLLDEKERAHISRYGITSTEKDLSADYTCSIRSYAAPETWKCSNENGDIFTKASDVWSLGCIILVMCSGMSLWDGLSETEMLEYLQQRMLPLNLDNMEEPLLSIIRDCLQYDYEKRPTLNEIQEKFLFNRQDINPLSNSLRRHELPTDKNESPSGDGGQNYGEDDSDEPSEALSRERDVLLACKKGSLEDLNNLIELGASLGDGKALCFAVSLKQWHEKEGRPGKTIVQSLVENGINLFCNDDLGQNPLHIAARMNDVEVIDILMKSGADVNIKNIQSGETPLHVALKNCAGVACIDFLLQSGASRTLQDNDGNNALHVAAQAALSCENLDAMSMILKFRGSSGPPANAKAENYRGYTIEDILKRLPEKMISTELKSILQKEGVDLHGESDSLEGERNQSVGLDIADLEDANMAGGNKSLKCTLILTEGKTANKFATHGRDFLGRDTYGSYTLCGKLMNVDSKFKWWSQNIQVKSIFAALGLKLEVGGGRYVFDKKNLRYGHIMLMMDEDSDGNHIRGLLINMFYCLCTELLKIPMFLQDFRTNLYKVINVETKETKSFMFSNDYRIWRLGIKEEEWTLKYFKGLASNSDEEVKEYFKHVEDHIRYFVWHGVIDANYIERAFGRFNIDDRKKWILEYEDGLYDTSPSSGDRMISYHGFIQKDLVPYFVDSVKRSMPSMMDGQKITQRRIVFIMRKQAQQQNIPTVAGLVSAGTAYHHRHTSLESTIVSMAQDFCWTNNLNLLKPNGLFGSRYNGRIVDPLTYAYLNVEISPIAHLIFRKEDDDFLDHDREDGKVVQPKWYAPIFPLILVNGAKGLGCGFKTRVLSYDVNIIIRNLERLMDNMATEEMIPSYRDFKGTVAKGKGNSYTITGKWDLDRTRTKLTIFELPLDVWYSNFEKDLQILKDANLITSFEIINKGPDGEAIHWYEISLRIPLDNETIESEFKLKKTVSSHIYLYNAQGHLRHYTSPNEVLHDYYIERLKIYEKRKDRMVKDGSMYPHVTAKDLWRNDLKEFKEAYNK